jgi:hypothetical protein
VNLQKHQLDIIKAIRDDPGAKICFASTPMRSENFYGRGLIESIMKSQEGKMISGLGGAIFMDDLENPPTKWHQVKIDKVTNGFVVEIGCKKFVSEKWEDLAKKLAEYWKDPVAAQKKYVK